MASANGISTWDQASTKVNKNVFDTYMILIDTVNYYRSVKLLGFWLAESTKGMGQYTPSASWCTELNIITSIFLYLIFNLKNTESKNQFCFKSIFDSVIIIRCRLQQTVYQILSYCQTILTVCKVCENASNHSFIAVYMLLLLRDVFVVYFCNYRQWKQ